LAEGEYIDSSTQTVVTTPAPTATERITTTTSTNSWTVKKQVAGNPNDITVRSGTEIITDTDRTTLSELFTYQQIWTNHLKLKPWLELEPDIWGADNLKDFFRGVFGDAGAAEYLRGYFRDGDFPVLGRISLPGSSFADLGSNIRLKSLRWRWVRFNPLKPFDKEYAAPPAGYQKLFHLLVGQSDSISNRNFPYNDVYSSNVKGVVQIVCNASDGAGWHTVAPEKFAPYKLEEPTCLPVLDYSKVGHSSVYFDTLPVAFITRSNIDPAVATSVKGVGTTNQPPVVSLDEVEASQVSISGNVATVPISGVIRDAIMDNVSHLPERQRETTRSASG